MLLAQFQKADKRSAQIGFKPELLNDQWHSVVLLEWKLPPHTLEGLRVEGTSTNCNYTLARMKQVSAPDTPYPPSNSAVSFSNSLDCKIAVVCLREGAWV
jgi:hypothetical protein